MERFLQKLDQKFASGDELTEENAPAIIAACKTYRTHAMAGLGDPLIDAGEKLLFGVYDRDGLAIPRFTSDLNDLRAAAVLFGQSMWYNIQRYADAGIDMSDQNICRFAMAHINLIWCLLEIVVHPESSFTERYFAITAALVHMSHGDYSTESAAKMLELRTLMFPNAEPFVTPPPEELVQFFPFNPSTLPKLKVTDRVQLL